MKYKTTKEDFAEFRKEAEYWIEYWGLKNWEFHFFHVENKGRAEYWANINGRLATLELNTEWNGPVNQWEIRKSAFHEVCEIMIVPLSGLATNVYDRDFVEGKTHDIIRRLENTIFKEKRGQQPLNKEYRMEEAAVEKEIQKKGLTAPRLTPDDIDSKIVNSYYHVFEETQLTVCCLVLVNGFTVTGESACVSPENFDKEVGEKVSYGHARDKIWALEGYLLKEKLFQPK